MCFGVGLHRIEGGAHTEDAARKIGEIRCEAGHRGVVGAVEIFRNDRPGIGTPGACSEDDGTGNGSKSIQPYCISSGCAHRGPTPFMDEIVLEPADFV